jgi:hypothetical protein
VTADIRLTELLRCAAIGYRAIPAAVATLGASVLAAFQFRSAWVRHITLVRSLKYELLKFENELREYRRTEPRPQREGVDAFLDHVHEISRAGHGEQPKEAAEKTVGVTADSGLLTKAGGRARSPACRDYGYLTRQAP